MPFINGVVSSQGGTSTISKYLLNDFSVNTNGVVVQTTGAYLTCYIPINNSLSVEFYTGSNQYNLCEYDSNKKSLDYWGSHSTSRTVTLTGGTNTKFLRVGFTKADLDNCFILDKTNNIYLYKKDMDFIKIES